MKKTFLYLIFFGSLAWGKDLFSMHGKNDTVGLYSKKWKLPKKSKANQRRKAREDAVRSKKKESTFCCELALIGLWTTLGVCAVNLMSESITKDNIIMGAAGGFCAGICFANRATKRKVKKD